MGTNRRMKGVLSRVFLGGTAGVILGVMALARPSDVFTSLGFPRVLLWGTAGGVTGLVLAYTRRFRRMGLIQFYLGWMFATTAGYTYLVVPLAASERELLPLWFGFVLGPLAGLGLGAFARWIGVHD